MEPGYWVRLRQKTWFEFWHMPGGVRWIVGLLASSIAFVSVYRPQRLGWSRLMPSLDDALATLIIGAAAGFALSLIVGFVRALKAVDSDGIRKCDKIAGERDRLRAEVEELKTPKMEIVFGKGEPYEDLRSNGYHLFRVGVRASTMRSVYDPSVEISSIEPPQRQFHLPLRLQVMHREERPIHPHKPRWYDVVDKWPDGTLQITHTTEGVERNLEPGKYVVTITASGRDADSVSSRFTIQAFREGLQFSQLEDPSTSKSDPSSQTPLRA
jgi:hypothetical protein